MSDATTCPTPYWQSPDGRAVIYHGDSLLIMAALPEKSVDFVFTDPPYGHNNNNGDLAQNRESALGIRKTTAADARPIANDGAEANGIFHLALYRMVRLLRDNCCCCCCCCCGGGGPDPMFARWTLLMDSVMEFKQQVIWDKGKIGMGWHYRRSTECVLVGQKGKGKTAWFDTSHKIENIIRPGDYGIKKIIPSADQHPTEKPVALAAHFIGLHSKRGQVVLDPFMGRGSTMIAALRGERSFIGCDCDIEWCRKSVARYEAEVADE
jgi:site-specific DNA-methyltransferase (adenine-specific)